MHDAPTTSPFRQPRAVWAVAFACVVSFMGIGLVDPILKSLAGQLHATPTQVEQLFTSYLVITAVAMLVTGWVSSRLGAKRTLIVGLVIIVVLGNISWRGPFYGVSVLMAIALVATLTLLPKTPAPARKQRLIEPLAALK